MIGTLAFIGVTIGCLFLPRLGDLYGRRIIFIVSLSCQTPILFMSAWTSNIYVLWTVAFLLGPCIIGRMSSGFLILMESVPTRFQASVGACIMVGEGLCPIIWTVYF